MPDVQRRVEPAVLQTLGQGTDHRDAERALPAEGWTGCGAGDWAIALRSPSGVYAARISPFDPGAPFSATLYRRAAHTGLVPRLDAEIPLEGGGNLLVMEFLYPVTAARASAYQRAIATRAPEVAELADLIATVHAEAARELPWWGPLDNNPANVMQRPDGRLVVIDPFYADGPNLYATVLSNPARVAASIPSAQRRHMFDLPLHSSGPVEAAVLEQMRAGLAAADIGMAINATEVST